MEMYDREENRSDSEEEIENYNKLQNLDEDTLKKIHLEYAKQETNQNITPRNFLEAESKILSLAKQEKSEEIHQYSSLYNLN